MMASMPNNAGKKQSASKMSGSGASSRNMSMRTTWKKLNVKKTHTHRGKRG